MMASLSDNSIKQYDTCLKKWFLFCKSNHTDLYVTSVPTVIHFLTQQYESGAQYGTLNSCRSALSLISDLDLGNDHRIKRFLKGIYRLRPPLPKYNTTWDVSLVLNYLTSWYPNKNLNLEKLSKKLATLLALITAHRVQTISKININNIEVLSNEIQIKIPDLIKTSRDGATQPTLILPFFRDKPAICPATTLNSYLLMTNPLRGSEVHLFISLKKPHKAVTSQTLSRWIKNILYSCGIDTSVFTAHSTRHAATSKAHKMGISLDLIRKTAGWSGSSNTFWRFYNRHIVIEQQENQNSFANSVLSD